MDGLDDLLRPVAKLINRQVQLQTPARALCDSLDGKVFAVRVRNTTLAMYFVIGGGEMQLLSSVDTEPDAAISGSLLSLAQMLRTGGEDLIRNAVVSLTGDALVASQFRDLLKHARPDLEEELSWVVGDAGSYSIAQILRGIGAWGRTAHQTMSGNIVEYLQEEKRSVPQRFEVDNFYTLVTTLRDDVARFDARLKIVEANVVAENIA